MEIDEDFQLWLAELQVLYDAVGAEGYVASCGADSWREYYAEDMSPHDAFAEETSYWGE